MAKIKLDSKHTPLIDAAIGLGDWMRGLPQLSEEDKTAVENIQTALKQLPSIPDNILTMYGFSIEQGDEIQGLIRSWDMSLEFFAGDPEQQGGLELFSSWLPRPESEKPQILAQKKQYEAYFHWHASDVCSFIQPEKAQQWIKEVNAPTALLEAGDLLRLEIIYLDYYSEIEIQV